MLVKRNLDDRFRGNDEEMRKSTMSAAAVLEVISVQRFRPARLPV